MSLQAIAKYQGLRTKFYTHFRRHFFLKLKLVDAGPIEDAHLWEARAWQNRRRPQDWFELRRKFRRVPGRLELAVSIQGELCGLVVGKPSHGKTRLKACHFEVKPDFDPDRKALLLLMHAMTLWGVFLGSTEVWMARSASRHWRITAGAKNYFF